MLASFPGALLGLGTFYRGDFGLISYPNAFYFRECFWDGEVPFWNPYSGGGTPFLGSWCSVLYPPVLIYLLLPLNYALANYCILHLYWGGIGMYVLARRWTNSGVASALGGVVFAFNGMTIETLNWPLIIAAQSWMPWVIWAVGMATRRGGRWIPIAAIFGTLQMLTGGPENILLTWIGAGVLGWIELKCRSVGFPRKVARFALIILLISALAVVQLLPFFNFLPHSDRIFAVEEEQSPMPGWGWANFILPLFYCVPSVHGSTGFPVYCIVGSYYCGAVGALASLGALFLLREKRVALTAALAVGCALMALGKSGWVLPAIIQYVPQLNVSRYPVKYCFLGVFAMALLTACFAGIMLRQNSRFNAVAKSRVLAMAILLYMGFAVFLIWFQQGYPFDENVRGFFRSFVFNSTIRCLVAVLAALFLLKSFTVRSQHRRWIYGALLISCVWIDLLSSTPRGILTVPVEVYEPGIVDLKKPPLLGQGRLLVNRDAELAQMSLPFKDPLIEMACKRKAVVGCLNLLDGYGKFIGNESLYFPEILDIWGELGVRTNLGSLGDFCGIRYFTVVEDLYSWRERTNVMPFVSIGLEPVFTNRFGIFPAICHEAKNLHEYAFVSEDYREKIRATRNRDARILNLTVTRHRIEIEVVSDRESLVTLAQSYYPAWRATIDGTNTTLYRANHAFQALEIPPGKHTIELDYYERGFYTGACLSFPVLIGLMWAGCRFRQRGDFLAKKGGSR